LLSGAPAPLLPFTAWPYTAPTSLLPFTAWPYAAPTSLLLRGTEAALEFARGARRGDPCEPLFFALALQGALEDLDELDFARILAYADDIFLPGSPAAVQAAFDVLCMLLKPLEFQVVPAKRAVYSQVEANSAAVANVLGIKLAREGITAAGTPVGSQAFSAAHKQEFASRACGLMDALDGFPLSVQDSWLLLHGSLQLRVAHLPSIGEWKLWARPLWQPRIGPSVACAPSCRGCALSAGPPRTFR
jgi:hypothetical protein